MPGFRILRTIMDAKALQKQLTRFFEVSSDLMCIADPRGSFLRTNPAFTETLGYTEEELLSRPFMDFVADEDKKRTRDEMASQMRTGYSLNFENRYRCKDGQYRWLSWRAFYDRSDGVTYAIGRDVTASKEEEESLRRLNAYVTQIIEAIPNMVFLKDADDLRFVQFNRAGEELLGLPRDQMLGRNDYDLFPREQADFFTAKDREVLAGAGVVDIPVEMVETRHQGTRTLHTKKVTIFDPQGRPEYLLGISEDITEQRRIEAEKARLEAQLQQAHKLESLGSLAGGLAHDMNNVLGAILGLASTRLLTEPAGTPAFRAFETIARAAERGGRMVERLLGFARQAPLEDRPVDLNQILREEVALLERTTLARVQINLDLADGLPLVRGDAGSLSGALMNLCVNAVDAMAGPGVLTLRSRRRDPWVEVAVIDNGVGMTRDVLEKAVDPFFTTKPTGQGTGLGLSLVYSAVKAHRGQMDIESQPGRGTTVTLSFPALAEAAAPAAEATASPAPDQRALEVLLIDDDELIRTTVSEILEVLGHRIVVATSGEQALDLLDHGLAPDAVILDLNMPGLGGAGTLPGLRARRPGVPVLLATGRADQNARDLAAGYPGVRLLAKPFSLTELAQALTS